MYLAKLANPRKICSGHSFFKSVCTVSHMTQSKSFNLFVFHFDSENEEFGPNKKKTTFVVYKALS